MATAAFLFNPSVGSLFTVTVGGTSEIPLYGSPKFDYIDRIEGYTIRRPIPVKYEVASDTDVEASFEDANIAISGNSRQDAYQALIEEILTAFDDWSADESALGPGPRKQLAVLRNYIAKATP
jgi:hypothetical protein